MSSESAAVDQLRRQAASRDPASIITLDRDYTPTAEEWKRLSAAAWLVERRAIVRNTAVGAAVLSATGRIYVGCNIEHKLRCHDVHAEVNALSSMVADGDVVAVALLVASSGRQLSPCGSCLDWIFQLGGASCRVVWQSAPDAPIRALRADELMPFYPQ